MRKKLDAFGNCCASRLGMLPGFETSWGSAAIRPELSVTIKKECYQRKVISI